MAVFVAMAVFVSACVRVPTRVVCCMSTIGNDQSCVRPGAHVHVYMAYTGCLFHHGMAYDVHWVPSQLNFECDDRRQNY